MAGKTRKRTKANAGPYKLPLRAHPDNQFVIVDANDRQIAICGISGDVDNNGPVIANRLANAANALHERTASDQIERLRAELSIGSTDPEAVVDYVLRFAREALDVMDQTGNDVVSAIAEETTE